MRLAVARRQRIVRRVVAVGKPELGHILAILSDPRHRKRISAADEQGGYLLLVVRSLRITGDIEALVLIVIVEAPFSGGVVDVYRLDIASLFLLEEHNAVIGAEHLAIKQLDRFLRDLLDVIDEREHDEEIRAYRRGDYHRHYDDSFLPALRRRLLLLFRDIRGFGSGGGKERGFALRLRLGFFLFLCGIILVFFVHACFLLSHTTTPATRKPAGMTAVKNIVQLVASWVVISSDSSSKTLNLRSTGTCFLPIVRIMA